MYQPMSHKESMMPCMKTNKPGGFPGFVIRDVL